MKKLLVHMLLSKVGGDHVKYNYALIQLVAIISVVLTSACNEPKEAPKVELSVYTEANQWSSFITNLNYEIELERVQLVAKDLNFTTSGQLHSSTLWHDITSSVVPTVHAHPGHSQGGEVIGELLGEFIFEWSPGDRKFLGIATLIAGQYSAAEFTFGYGSMESSPFNDQLMDHSILLSGTATKNEQVLSFLVTVDSPSDRKLIGVPFDAMVKANLNGELVIRFHGTDPSGAKSIFDQVDFLILDQDNDGVIVIGPDMVAVEDTYNIVRRSLLTHDHYSVEYMETKP